MRVVCEGINILTHQFSEDISKLDDTGDEGSDPSSPVSSNFEISPPLSACRVDAANPGKMTP